MVKKCVVVGCLVIKDGKLLMLNHVKLGVWLPPGGHMEEHEFPDETALRETKEETGLDVEIIYDDAIKHRDEAAHTLGNPFTIVYEYVPYTTQEPHIHFDIVYLARIKGGSINANKESREVRWFTAPEIATLNTLPSVRSFALAALERYGKSF